ncbi:MAG TPA: polysaccharide biosynthesis/export family protein [Thermoanaerobaculia bacterium]|nr:polysaccharide biosynthesis/export family protein [Thermoanaerobaculia bacterium]
MKIRAILLLAIVALSFAALAQDLPLLSADATVGPRDILDIKVLEDPTMSGRVTVGDDGQILLNVVGKVAVAGLSAAQIEAKLASVVNTFLTKATISVQVVEFASKPISVVGAVVKPGRIGATSSTTLIQAITEAGGLAAGHGKEIYVLRTARNGLSEQLSIDVDELMVRGNPDVNIPLAPNDLVNIPVDPPVNVYVMGEVMRPGTAQFRRSQNPTLLQAIASSGGPTDRASKKVIIKRITNGKQETITVNFRDIIRGKKQDVVLQDNDTVVLEEALF